MTSQIVANIDSELKKTAMSMENTIEDIQVTDALQRKMNNLSMNNKNFIELLNKNIDKVKVDLENNNYEDFNI